MSYSPKFKYRSSFLTLLFIVIFLQGTALREAGAQTPNLLDRFTGTWSGKGKLMGADAEFMMTWEWVLEHRFVRLTFRNKMRGANGADRILKAQAFYRPEPNGQFSGTWFDSRGMVLPLKASAEGDTLTTLWGAPETEEGRTVYRLLDRDKMEVDDFILREDEWRRFGHAKYNRAVEN